MNREEAMRLSLDQPPTRVDISTFRLAALKYQCSGCAGLSDSHDPVLHAQANAQIPNRTNGLEER